MSFEYVVRPYQTPDAQGRIIVPSTRMGLPPQRAVLIWSGQINKTIPPAQISSIKMACCNEDHNELSRQTSSQRIIGSDGESYVDVARVEKMKLQKQTAGGSGCENAFNFLGFSDAAMAAPSGVGTGTNPDSCEIALTLKN